MPRSFTGILTFILFVWICTSGVKGQSTLSTPSQDKLSTQIEAYFKSNAIDFNGSILIAEDGETIFEKYYGWTDQTKTEEIHSHSRFNVGSLAKEIPAIAIYDLILNNQLSYDDTLKNILTDLPDWSKKLNIRDLLFYNCGLPPMNFQIIQNDALAYDFLRSMPSSNFMRAGKYSYSNWNNFILAKIAEEMTGERFQFLVASRYFEKLGIRDSFYSGTATDTSKNMTTSFSDVFGPDETGNPKFKRFELCYGPLYMTARDVLKWIEYIYQRHYLGGQNTREFYAPTSLERQGPLGILQFDQGKLNIHIHGGFAFSYGTSTYRNYNNGIAIILMTNNNKGVNLEELSEFIIRILSSN